LSDRSDYEDIKITSEFINMRYVIGLDAGGTKTSTVVMDESRRELGRGVGGPGNYHSAGKEATLTAIQSSIDEALAHAYINRNQIGAACFAMSGVDRPVDKEVARIFAQVALPGVQTVVCNDAVAALYSGAGKAEGVVVIAGTGSIIYGFTPDGRRARASGWGYHLGDEGSGWWIAEQSLFAIVHAHDGCGPATDLTARYLARLNLANPEDLITWAYSPAWTRDNVASLAVLTLDAAQAGDAVASGIVRRGVDALALAVQVVVRKLAMDSTAFNVVLFGSLFRSEFYVSEMWRSLREQSPRGVPLIPQVDAAAGAAWLALDVLNGSGQIWIR
jgi:N-acetylglucosamine kinase-like BadF-type ATPase